MEKSELKELFYLEKEIEQLNDDLREARQRIEQFDGLVGGLIKCAEKRPPNKDLYEKLVTLMTRNG